MKAKRLAALALCLFLLPLAPTAAMADDPEFWVGYTAITTTADASDEGWVWAASAKTLTLTDAALRGADKTSSLTNASAVCLPGGSTVVLAGDNTLLGGTSDGTLYGSAGLFGKGALTVTGGGSLTAVGGEVKERNSSGRCGIYAQGNLTFDSGFTGSVLAVGGDGTESGGGPSFGIHADGDTTIAGTGSLAAVGGRSGSFTVSGGSYGIECDSLSITAAANVTAVGGQALGPFKSSAYSRGIAVNTKLAVSAAAHVTAVGGHAEVVVDIISDPDANSAFSQGIAFSQTNNPSEMTLSGNANVTAIGGKSATSSGLFADGIGSLTIEGGAVLTAVGGDASGWQSSASYGLFLIPLQTLPAPQNNVAVTVTSGALVAKGGNATYSYGLDFGTWNGGTATLSLGTSTTDDAVIVAHADNSATTTKAIDSLTAPPTPLVGSNSGQYVVYGKGKYAEKDTQDEFTHVFTTKQTAVPATPFVIIDGGNTGAGLTLSGNQKLTLSGISVVIAGDVTSADAVSAGFRSPNQLTLEGSGALVCLGGTSTGGSSHGANLLELTIGSACSLVAVGGSAGGPSNHGSIGLITSSGLTSAGYITAVGGTAQGLGSQGASFAGQATLTAGGLSAVGGTATSNDGNSIGILALPLALNGASVTAVGGYSNGDSVGVTVHSASITAGSLRAVGGSGKASAGLSSPTVGTSGGAIGGSVACVGGSAACVGGHASNFSYGVTISAADNATTSARLTVGDTGGLCAVGGIAQDTLAVTSAGLRLNNASGSAVSRMGVLTAFGEQVKPSGGPAPTDPLPTGSFGLLLSYTDPLTWNGPYVTLSGIGGCMGYASSSIALGPTVHVKTGSALTGEGASLITNDYTVYPTYKYLRTVLTPAKPPQTSDPAPLALWVGLACAACAVAAGALALGRKRRKK